MHLQNQSLKTLRQFEMYPKSFTIFFLLPASGASLTRLTRFENISTSDLFATKATNTKIAQKGDRNGS
jgi:hypothetical protein